MTEMMVMEIREPGGPEALVPARRPVPQPGPGQVLIRIASAGVNGPDIMQRRGLYNPPPGASDLPGLEVAGEIAGLGAGVTRWAVGDRVCALTKGGAYAEYVAVEAGHVLPVPEGLSLVDAGGLCETYFTVWSNFFFRHDVPEGSLFLVHGGSGGIGSTAIQLGRALGLRVFATAGSAESCAFCVELGAERAINYRDEDFVEVVKAAGGRHALGGGRQGLRADQGRSLCRVRRGRGRARPAGARWPLPRRRRGALRDLFHGLEQLLLPP